MQEHGVSLHAQTVIHSDQGCHYTSCKFIELVERSDLRRSMSRKGNCRDNAPQESFFGHMKDLIDLTDNLSFGEAIQSTYNDFYSLGNIANRGIHTTMFIYKSTDTSSMML